MDKTVKIKRMTKEARTVPIVCSWCERLIRLAVWDIDEGSFAGTSHGICEDCHDGKMKEYEELAR